jgi:hypothetical protein
VMKLEMEIENIESGDCNERLGFGTLYSFYSSYLFRSRVEIRNWPWRMIEDST